MAAPKGGISIDWQSVSSSGSPAAELEVVGSFPPSFTPRPPAATRALVGSFPPSFTPRPPAATRAHDDSYDDGGAMEFADRTDQQLQDFIRQWEAKTLQGVLDRTPDGGIKLRARIGRAKKELEHRRVAGRMKDDAISRQAVQVNSTSANRGDVFTFNPDDEVFDSTADKYFENSGCTPSTKTYTQVKGAAYKEGRSLSQNKCAYLKKDGRRAKYSMNHPPKTCVSLPKSTDYDRLNTDIDRRKQSTLRSCTKNPHKNNTVDSKGTRRKFLEENTTFGSNGRCDLAQNKTSASFKVKKDIVLLDDDDDTKPARLAADVDISNKRDEPKIYYPSRTDPEAVELTYSDMKCLEPEVYLKSPVINFFLQYLKKSRPRRDLYMFNTYFYSKLEEALSTLGDRDSKFSKLRRWWRSVDIFKKAYIILPINETMHWSLIIVCMPTKEADSGPIVLHLDSLGLHNSQKLFDIIESYLEAEWRYLQKDSSYDVPFSRMVWKRLLRNINGEKVEVPRQRNEYDCGLFMLYYIDKFMQEAPQRLTKERLGMFGRKWFNHEEVSGLREKIRALLFDLSQSVQEDDEPPEEWHPGDHSDGEDKDADTVMAITHESSVK